VFELLKIEDGTRQFLGEFETREEAEARRAEIAQGDPGLEDVLIITSTGEARSEHHLEAVALHYLERAMSGEANSLPLRLGEDADKLFAYINAEREKSPAITESVEVRRPADGRVFYFEPRQSGVPPAT
jgi:hypothetical protein